MADGPQDVIGRMVTKALGGRSPEEFVPVIVPKDIKTPAELMADEPEKDSIKGIARKFIPIDIAKGVGDIGEDVFRFGRSLTPEHIIGARGEIDLPEPLNPNTLIYPAARASTKELTLPRPRSGEKFPAPPPLPPPPHELLGKLPEPWKR